MTYRFDPSSLPYSTHQLDAPVPEPINTEAHPGSYAVVLHDEDVRRRLERVYGRVGLALKCVPLRDPSMHPALAGWDGVSLGMASLVQNLIHLDGLSPRVYGLATVNGTHAAQVTAYIPQTADPRPNNDQLLAAFRAWGVRTRTNFDIEAQKGNWRDGLFVDFSGLYLDHADIDAIVAETRRRAMRKKGRPSDKAYQTVPELDIPGDRVERALPCPITDWIADRQPLDTLDIGCNLGGILRSLAAQQGVRRAVGVERDDETAAVCRQINVLLGAWNVDVIGASMPAEAERLPALDWSFVSCLSAVKYMGDADAIPWLASLAPALWLEGHGDVSAEHYEPALRRAFDRVERLSDATDNKRRAQFVCASTGGTPA